MTYPPQRCFCFTVSVRNPFPFGYKDDHVVASTLFQTTFSGCILLESFDKVLRELRKGQVGDFVLRPNELLQSRSCLTVRGPRILLDVYTDVILHVLDQAVKPLQ